MTVRVIVGVTLFVATHACTPFRRGSRVLVHPVCLEGLCLVCTWKVRALTVKVGVVS